MSSLLVANGEDKEILYGGRRRWPVCYNALVKPYWLFMAAVLGMFLPGWDCYTTCVQILMTRIVVTVFDVNMIFQCYIPNPLRGIRKQTDAWKWILKCNIYGCSWFQQTHNQGVMSTVTRPYLSAKTWGFA